MRKGERSGRPPQTLPRTVADELGDIVVGRVGKDVRGGVELLDLGPFGQHGDAVSEVHCFVEVMGYEDNGLTQFFL
jgi:hypothetical protein